MISIEAGVDTLDRYVLPPLRLMLVWNLFSTLARFT